MSAINLSNQSNRTHDQANANIRSSKVEDVARSVAYTVFSPVVFGLSFVPAALTIVPLSCCCIGMAAQSGADGDVENGARFLDAGLEALTGIPAVRCVVKINKAFYNWAKPYQSRVEIINP